MKKLVFSILSMLLPILSYAKTETNDNFVHAQNVMYEEVVLGSGESLDAIENSSENAGSKSLNDIRFEGWNSEDWLDNDYIRKLRKYLDAYYKGKIINEELESYKKYVNGKFIIANIEPYMLGGVFIKIIFLDLPTRIFESWVYSYVDEEKEEVTGYEVRGVYPDEEIYDFNKDEILETMKEHPELKAW